MKATALREGLAALADAEAAGPDAARAAAMRALAGGQGALQAKAAGLLLALGEREAAPELAAALASQLATDGRRDGGALGKLALARALLAFDWRDEALWRKAIRCRQWTPVWGGRVDCAAALRGVAALGLLRGEAPVAGLELARLLADPEREARAGAIEALREAPTLWGLPLLRLAAAHEEDPGLLADAFEGLLERGGLEAIELAEELAGADEERRGAAALALAAAGGDEALGLLLQALAEQPLPAARRGLWLGLLNLRGEAPRARLRDWLRGAGPGPREEARETALAIGAGDWLASLNEEDN
jgi:hypothetical protein